MESKFNKFFELLLLSIRFKFKENPFLILSKAINNVSSKVVLKEKVQKYNRNSIIKKKLLILDESEYVSLGLKRVFKSVSLDTKLNKSKLNSLVQELDNILSKPNSESYKEKCNEDAKVYSQRRKSKK